MPSLETGIHHRAPITTFMTAIAGPSMPKSLDLEVAARPSIFEGTQSRPAQFSCFGMHEWAMVYRIDPKKVSHDQQPLRLQH